MATITFNKSSLTNNGSYILGKIEYSYTQSIANNTSTLTCDVYVKKYNDGLTLTDKTSGTYKYELYVDGELKTGSKSLDLLTTYQKIGTFQKTINHNDNGQKTFKITGWVKLTTNTGSVYYNKPSQVDYSVTLTTIPRASAITSAGNVTLGDKCSIKWTPLASTFAYKVKLSCGGITHTSDYITPGSTSAHTYSATMSISYWAGAMPKAYSGTCTATLYTYTSTSSSSAIGSDMATFTLTLPSSTKPTISSFTTTLNNGWNGYYIQGKSTCTLSATFAAGAGSSISSCSISGTGLSKTGTGTSLSGTTSTFGTSGNITYTAKVTDGRASATTTKTITVYAYSKPTLTLSAARTSTSGSVTITYKASCASINSKNSLKTLTISKKLSTSSSWTTVKTLTLSSTSASNSVTLTGFGADSSYNLKATVSDAYGETSNEATAYVTSEFRILNIKANKKGIAFGQLATDDNVFACNLIPRFTQQIHFGEDLQGNFYKDVNDAGNHIVYILTGQNTSGGALAGLAIHSSSVYVPNEGNDGIINLGSSSRKWNQLYAANGTIATSDKKVKTNINNMSETQEQLFNKLQPVTFEFKNGSSGRTHYGFISQDVENSLTELKLTGKDFAGFCKDLKVDDNNNVVLDENGQAVYDYSLRYSEFIALNTHMIQKLQNEIAELKAEIQELKSTTQN